MARIPSYYIPHGGGPCFFMDWEPSDTWDALANWMRSLANQLPGKPKAILCISAHWEEPQFTLGVNPVQQLFYDYYGFPEHTYELAWPAQAPEFLYPRVQELLRAANIEFALDPTRNLDHGVFIPGLLIYPQAGIPSMQISLHKGLNPLEHVALGKALAPLRDEGVLIIGSGMSFHNMGAFRWGDNEPIPGADAFDAWLTATVTTSTAAERETRFASWAKAPQARLCHPREEHLIPLMCIAGTSEAAGELAFHCRAMGAPLSAYCFK